MTLDYLREIWNICWKPGGVSPGRSAACLLAILMGIAMPTAWCQQELAAEPADPGESGEPEVLLLSLDEVPTAQHLATSLSDPDSRDEVLLTLLAAERLLELGPAASSEQIPFLDARFRDDRAWLDQLAGRYPEPSMRGSVLDPSAWYIVRELEQHRKPPGSHASPLGPGSQALLRQLFDRSDERLAAAVLPQMRLLMEFRATALWQELLELAAGNEAMLAVISGLNADWFDRWRVAEPPAPVNQTGLEDVIPPAIISFQALAASAARAEPPDALRLKRLRFSLLTSLPDLDELRARDAKLLLRLSRAVDGLSDRKYLSFTETLLWVAAELLLIRGDDVPHPPAAPAGEGTGTSAGNPLDLAEEALAIEQGSPQEPPDPSSTAVSEPEIGGELPPLYQSALPRALAEIIPLLSNAYAREFSTVDPRINAALATAFDVVQNLQSGELPRSRYAALQQELANTVTQLVLLIPDMNYYFDQPVRNRISEEIDICISIAAANDRAGGSSLTREQFDGCITSIVDMAESQSRAPELAGDSDGPFGPVQLKRELALTPGQRIDYVLGYLRQYSGTACQAPELPLPNPLEWSTLVTMMVWFAEQAPVYFQTPEHEALVNLMRQQGKDLLQEMARQVDCISGAGVGINDPVSRGLADYRDALDDLVTGIRDAELEFRANHLEPGADIVLSDGAAQTTSYRTQDLMIGPCERERTCGMTDELEATRALVGLFPDPYLIADQTRQGRIEICYDNIQWVQRRADPVRRKDSPVANYHARLSFDLIGRYIENGEVTPVFGSNFVSPDEYHYLFAAANDEVLNDTCPTEWVGSKIVVSSLEGGFKVVPDRLTYLAAARSQPSQVITQNWNRGAEWRDWFVTNLGVTAYDFGTDETMGDRVNQHLRSLYQALQSELYDALLAPPLRGSGNDSLHELIRAVGTGKTLVRTQMNLFYPDFLLDSDEIRAALEGTGSLLDAPMLRRFRNGNVTVESINDIGRARLEELQALWNRQPEIVLRSGSVATGLANAMVRLNALYFRYFALPARAAESDGKKAGFRAFRG